ncbi:MAG: DUF302 domain-containing protein [Acidobacteriia bacterium]|nr:DUF302 domain-containing protein [Terriglobia bacterium]
MNAVAAGPTYRIAERFDKVLKLIRGALADSELSIVGEIDSTDALNREAGKKVVRSRILFVDCPLLVFEALALDRASGVFFPLHVLVSVDGDRTQVSVVNPAGLFDARLPVGAAEPMEKLQARVTLALESVLLRSVADNH